MSDLQEKYDILINMFIGKDVYTDVSAQLENVLNDIFVAQTAKAQRNGLISEDVLARVQRRGSNIMPVTYIAKDDIIEASKRLKAKPYVFDGTTRELIK